MTLAPDDIDILWVVEATLLGARDDPPVIEARADQVIPFYADGKPFIFYPKLEQEIMLAADGDFGAALVVREVAKRLLAGQHAIPQLLQQYIFARLGNDETKRRQGRPRVGSFHVAIRTAVSLLIELCNIPATRSPASQQQSACSVVAKVANRSEKAVEKIWNSRFKAR
jgi:hypothetical protein